MKDAKHATQNLLMSTCEVCHGTGYIPKKIVVSEYDPDTPVEFASPCPICQGNQRDYNTGIPKMFSEADMQKFDFTKYGEKTENIEKIISSFWKEPEQWERANKGLYIWSKTKGTGKTFLACCIASSVQVKHGKKIRFISSTNYLKTIIEAGKREPGEQDILYAYKNCDLLVLDDLGGERKGEWQDQELLNLIEYRTNNGKSMIITSSHSIADLKNDERIVDRLGKLCIPIHLPETSIRQKNAIKENEKFIKRILGTPVDNQ